MNRITFFRGFAPSIPTRALPWACCKAYSVKYNIWKLNLLAKTDISKTAWINPGPFMRGFWLHMLMPTHTQQCLDCNKSHMQMKLLATWFYCIIDCVWSRHVALLYVFKTQHFFSSVFFKFLLMLTMYEQCMKKIISF